MKDFLEYIFDEVKNKRLDIQNATDLLCQFETRTGSNNLSFIHPLLQQNTSTLSEQRFSSTFTGEEFFIKDYMIKGRRGLPGAVIPEMARVAVTAALDLETAVTLKDSQAAIHLKDIIWAQPLLVKEQPVQVHIRLYPEINGEIVYQIYSSISEDDGARATTVEIIYSQGSARLAEINAPPTLNLNAMKANCSQNIISSAQIYEMFKAAGIEYGLGYQAIERMYIGADRVLAKLSIPDSLMSTHDQYFLHPSIMESTIQAAAKLMMGADETKILLPRARAMALQELEILGKCTPVMWAVIEHSQEDETKIDIDLCNEQGTILVKMKGYSAGAWAEEEAEPAEQPAPIIKKMLFKIDWKEQAVSTDGPLPEFDGHTVILCEMADRCSPEQLQEQLGTDENLHIITLQSGEKQVEKSFQYHTIRVFEEIQNIFREKADQNVFIQLVYGNYREQRLLAALSGLLNTARYENSQVTGQLVEIELEDDPAVIAAKLMENRRVPTVTHVRYQDGKRWTSGWSQLEVSLEDSAGEVMKPWKDKGIYLITGGAGGLGLIFAKEIAASTKEAVVILTGRSLLSPDKQARIDEVEALGAKIRYEQVDVIDKKGIQKLIQKIMEEYGGLNGIIHGAGFFRDNLILKKTKQEFEEVLAPKVLGLINLDEASRGINLDFFVCFSSRAAVNGNPGQADYATANAFMDAYAGYRNNLVVSNQRHGQTIAINWPFWKEGGMNVSDEVEKFWQNAGIVPMETQTGIRALYEGLRSGNDQVIVVVEQIQNLNAETPRLTSNGRRPELKGLSLAQCLDWDLKRIINRLLKIPREKIETKKNLMEFGFNSIGLSQFAIQLSKLLGVTDLTPAIFFRYSTIESLIEYFLSKYRTMIEEVYQEGAPDSKTSSKLPAIISPKRLIQGSLKAGRQPVTREMSADFMEPIAIIGMSGRFPGARNIEELWTVLANGQDMVKEIPIERFDWRPYYSENQEPGKTVCKWLGCIPGVREFDPLFFEISPREAEVMDPQQRLILQEAWRALEDAGYGPGQIKKGKIGMFVGVEQGDYQYIAGEGNATSTSIAILAARLACFLDLHGPVMAIDTACSSGLVAVHQAFSSLRNGECDTAIVAGVRLLLTPLLFIAMSEAGMLSADGKCHTFDKSANGLVPGEAVAAVVLKRLSQAEADGDPIYAVIKGSGINYDGKTNGINAPSGNSQIALLKDVYHQYRINPEEIGYIVTHGTGTKLGDSVEINSLYDVFKDYTKKQNYCALTSTKTNFGHTMAPSGLVSLISLVQALRHETIPASLHCEQENDYINWQESPFYVNKTNKPWPAGGKIRTGVDHEMGAGHRMGAVSAFGASGTNAHMVVQSYSPKEDVTQKNTFFSPYYLLALSAKTEESLQEKIKDLIAVLQDRDHQAEDFAQISYTLLVGRQHFNIRFAIVIQDREDAIYVLKQVGGKEKLPNLFQGKVPWNFTGHKVIEEYISEQIKKIRTAEKNKHQYQEIVFTLADLYCQGYEIDWKQLFGDCKLKRLHLPTYPFVKESYWIPEHHRVSGDMARTLKGGDGQSVSPNWIHPLLQQNTSDLSEQRYSSTFSGKEFFLMDHMVRGQKVFPRFAYLEMARAGIEAAVIARTRARNTAEGRPAVKLKNIVWAKPIKIDGQSLQVHLRINPETSGELNFEIYSGAETDDSEAMYSQGRAALAESLENQVLNLKALQTKCNKQKVSGSDIYNTYKTIGLEYGPWYQGIEMIYVGQGLVLAKLSLPSSIADTETEYILHPSMMDAALQAVIGFTMDGTNGNLAERNAIKPMVPIALQELEVLGKTTSSMWAFLRCNEASKTGAGMGRLDIDLCDDQGQVCVRLKGLDIQEDMETSTPNAFISDSQEPYELMTFEEIWQEEALERSQTGLGTIVCFLSDPAMQQEMSETLTTLEKQAKLIFISQGTEYQKQTPQNYRISRTDRHTYEEAFRSIRADARADSREGEIDAVLYMWALEDTRCIKDYSCIVYIIQAMAAAGLGTKRVLLTADFKRESLERCYLESWIGFERSMGVLLRDMQFAALYQVSEGDHEVTIKDWTQKIRAELQAPKISSVFYQDGKRYTYKIRPVSISGGDSLVKPGGTYLITGGCGGLGFLFAKYLAGQHPVNLILSGRSALDAGKEKKLKTLEEMGSQVIYLQADVGDFKTMKVKLKQARERFGAINGVIHAAGLPEDQFIFKKRLEDFEKVLRPKITGTLVLDKLLKEEPLDFTCYFSSLAAIIGDFGSCDYAVGNRFLMAYAHYRNRHVSRGNYRGKAVAINWPLWREGGMGFGNDENTKMYLKTSGQRILETEEGVAAFDKILGQNGDQYLIIPGQPSRVHQFLGLAKEQPVAVPPMIRSSEKRRAEMKGLSVEQCVEWDLKDMVNRLLKIPREKIDREKNLADFGFNSMGLTQFALLLIKHFGIQEITPSIFYGYSTIEKLTQYFVQNHHETIRQIYREATREEVSPAKTPASQPVLIKQNRFAKNSFTPNRQEPIAIIGMSGRFPGANNIDELWNVLVTGANMVKEIPKERFDWRQFYGDPHKEPGKINCKWLGYISGVSEFDPLFFEIRPREAELMDPKQRLLLEESWNALEDAGYGPVQIKSQRIGMFVGVEQGDYQILTQGRGNMGSNHNGILAARLAYFLNLDGPVMALDTCCSSGLVAVHQAISSIRNGECDTAIAAGVNLMLTPYSFIGMSQAGLLSPDGMCYAFDRRANGIVPGEAVAAVVLKRLSRAEADGDPIYATIKGSGINYDGKTNGITTPSGASQTNLYKMVYDQYRINPEEIEYMIPHGTGTKLGDSVEINALNDAFKSYTSRYGAPKQGYCALTSPKTNFGYTFAASGLVSLISMAQALRHEMIPASLHCERENDYINWKESPFYVNKTNRPWTAAAGVAFGEGAAFSGNRVRTGAVTAIGMGGTKVHMVLQSYSPAKGGSPEEAPYYLLALSAKTEGSLLEKARDLLKVLENDTSLDLTQLSYTLLQGRQHFNHRCAIVVQEREDAAYGLKQIESKEKIPNLFHGNVPRDFTGQKAIAEYAQELLKQSQTLKEQKSQYQETLFALADFYCQGYELDWNGLFGGSKPRRINLPTYPFAKEYCWASVEAETYGQMSLQVPGHNYPDIVTPVKSKSKK